MSQAKIVKKPKWKMRLILASVCVSILYWFFFIHKAWTGTYHQNTVIQNSLLPESKTVMEHQPEYVSNINQFFSLKKCKEWGASIRAQIKKMPGEKEDAVVCRRGCVMNENGLGSCLRHGLSISTFEE